MLRQNLLLLSLGLVLTSLTGCHVTATCRSHEFREPGLFGADVCGDGCGESCGEQTCGQSARVGSGCGHAHCPTCKANARQKRCRTAPLYPGDVWGLECTAGCGTGCDTCGGPVKGGCSMGGCSSCGSSVSSWSMGTTSAPTMMPSPGCGCGEHAALMPFPGPVQPATVVPDAPAEEFKAPAEAYDADVLNAAPGSGGSAPVTGEPPLAPPSEDPMPAGDSEPRLFNSDPPLPKDLDTDGSGAAPQVPAIDPVGWEIPALPES